MFCGPLSYFFAVRVSEPRSYYVGPDWWIQYSVNLQLVVATQEALVVKNLIANAGDIRDVGSIPGWGSFPREGNSNSLQSSCLENLMDSGVWRLQSMGSQESQTRLSTHTPQGDGRLHHKHHGCCRCFNSIPQSSRPPGLHGPSVEIGSSWMQSRSRKR